MRARLRPDRVAIVAVVLLLGLASLFYFVIQRGKLGDTQLATDKTLVMTLAALLLVIAIALVWFMFRQLAGLIAERREGVLGSRLQSRVVFTFLFLIFIPALILFAGAVTVVSRMMKDLAPPELEQIAAEGADAADAVYRAAARDARRFARAAAVDLGAWLQRGETRSQAAVASRLRALRDKYGVAAIGYQERGGRPVGVSGVSGDDAGAERPGEVGRLPTRLAERAFAEGRAIVTRERLAYGWRALAIVPLGRDAPARGIVWVVEALPENVVARLERLERTHRGVADFRRRRPAVKRLYVVLFALLTAVVLFGAVWTGLLVARQVTDPIRSLMKGTEALGRGDFAHRVRAGGGDEIGRLAASFNTMAARIEQQQAALEQRRRYIEMLLEAIPVGVLSVDGKGRVWTANRAALEALRLEDRPRGRDLRELLGEERQAVWQVLRPAVTGEASRVAAEVAIRAEGTIVSLEVTAERFATTPDARGTLVVIEDMTRLRRAERLAAWGEVARQVAHEIKNPLTPIRLSAERIERRYRQDPEAARSVIAGGVRTIVREVEGLRTLVDEFSRIARMPDIKPVEADLRETVRDVAAVYAGEPGGPAIETRIGDPLPPHRFDPDAMRRVLINLVENAIAAAGRDGHVTISTSWHAAHHTAVLEVADDGEGLPAGDRERLFLPTFTRRPGGTGLGLAIVNRIITEHGGWIRAEDNPGGGTRMVVELPVAGPRAAASGGARENG